MTEDKQNIEDSEPFGLEHVQQQVDQVEEVSQSGHVEPAHHIDHFEHIEQRFDHFEASVPAAAAIEQDPNLGNEPSLEDMDSQLNPGKYANVVRFGWAAWVARREHRLCGMCVLGCGASESCGIANALAANELPAAHNHVTR